MQLFVHMNHMAVYNILHRSVSELKTTIVENLLNGPPRTPEDLLFDS